MSFVRASRDVVLAIAHLVALLIGAHVAIVVYAAACPFGVERARAILDRFTAMNRRANAWRMRLQTKIPARPS